MNLRRRLADVTGTVRFRITGVAVVAVLVVLVAAGVLVVTAQRRVLTEAVDEAAVENVDRIEGFVRDVDLPAELTALGEDDTMAQVVREDDGTVLVSSPNVEGRPALDVPPLGGSTQRIRTVHGLPDDEGAGFRVVSRRVDGPDGPVLIHVAATLDDIDDSVGVLTRSLVVAIPVVVLLLTALVWWLVGRTLRPVERIRAEVAVLGASELDRRVPEPARDDEIARLARTMNEMLGRLDDASQRQRRFVADASHELRSPLTRMRTMLEVDLAHPQRADPVATHRSVLEETIGLQRLVDDLLHLASSDAGSTQPRHRQPVDLDDVVVRLVRRVQADERVRVDMAAVTGAQVVGDADQLTRAVGNVVDNAVRHAAGHVTVTLAEHDHSAVLAIADDGPGIPLVDQERVFERFTRLDAARSARTGGAGLGLAIARDIVEQHGGTIAVDPTHEPGARFVITLPASGSGGQARERSLPPTAL